jgi:hypothetical protein
MTTLKEIGAELRRVTGQLQRDYAAISETPEKWANATPQAWEAVWAGIEAVVGLEAKARGQGGHGCWHGKAGCPPEQVVNCDACARKAEGEQGGLL